jgi:hypothetical protein
MRWALLFVYLYSFTVSSSSFASLSRERIDGMRWGSDGMAWHEDLFRFLYSHDEE